MNGFLRNADNNMSNLVDITSKYVKVDEDVLFVRYAYVTVASPYVLLFCAFLTLAFSDLGRIGNKLRTAVTNSEKFYSSTSRIDVLIPRAPKIMFILLTSLFYLSHCACESIPGIALMPIAANVWGFSEKFATLLLTAYLFGCLFGRIIGLFVSVCIAPTRLLAINISLLMTGTALLLFYSLFPANHVLLLSCLVTIGFGISTLCTTGLLFVNQQMALTSKKTSRILIAGSVGYMIAPYCAAILLERVGHVTVFCLMTVTAAMTCVAFVALLLLISYTRRKYSHHSASVHCQFIVTEHDASAATGKKEVMEQKEQLEQQKL